MFEVGVRVAGGVATFLAHVELGAAFLVGVLERSAVNLLAMRLERTALGESFSALGALVRPYASVSASVTLQVKRVVEALAAEGADVAFGVTVTFDVSIEQSSHSEHLLANFANKSRRAVGVLIRRNA